MYMSVEDQYFWEFILVISIGITFVFWRIKNYIDTHVDEPYLVGYDQGWSDGWDDCYAQMFKSEIEE